MDTIRKALCSIGVVLISAPALANWLVNPGFEVPPILGAGQSDVEIAGQKAIQTDPMGAGYDHSITGIAGWTYATPGTNGTSSDHGIGRPTYFGDSSGPRMLFINNWDRRVSQTVSQVVEAGRTYRATVTFGMSLDDPTDGKAGLFQLIAGGVDPLNPDTLSPDAIVLGQIRIGSVGWNGAPADLIVGGFQLITISIDFAAAAADAAIGRNLTVSMQTESDSAGITNWDDVSLEMIPEPATVSSIGFGMLLLVIRRGRRSQ